nr:gamma-glutamylcyclotransferase-like [Cherax quadricarinatus]XP_053640563.1 gamma-glutamylcyclotransferase-like [Cherax quadricarinatus]XP_053640564.1 gamma-glutamylcyclotransferase-like [Cherax quadricarinatus]
MKMASQNCFLYFAYGSNLLKKRIHVNNPSAKMISVAKLKDYRLDFILFSQNWQGATATIVEDPGNFVYGVIWEIGNEDMAKLDRQEGVNNGVYKVLEVDVETPNGESVRARCYQQLITFTEDKRPSSVYKNVIIQGARENGLPENYIKFLESIEDNGYSGEVILTGGSYKITYLLYHEYSVMPSTYGI